MVYSLTDRCMIYMFRSPYTPHTDLITSALRLQNLCVHCKRVDEISARNEYLMRRVDVIDSSGLYLKFDHFI
jgi:hypothetical protein